MTGVILGLGIGAVGVVLNLRLARGAWTGTKLALGMLGILVLCFVVVVLIGASLGFLFPAQLGS